MLPLDCLVVLDRILGVGSNAVVERQHTHTIRGQSLGQFVHPPHLGQARGGNERTTVQIIHSWIVQPVPTDWRSKLSREDITQSISKVSITDLPRLKDCRYATLFTIRYRCHDYCNSVMRQAKLAANVTLVIWDPM